MEVNMKKIVISVILIIALASIANAQEDAAKCKDHPLLTRLENFYISDCVENYNELQLRTSSSKTETREGNRFYIYYRYNFDAGVKAKSPLQIIKNYEVAITKNGGKLIYKNSNSSAAPLEATYYFSTKGKDYWVQLTSFAGNGIEVEAYGINILEMEPMKQEVRASDMLTALNTSGHVALYINFDTGNATIKPESGPIIDEIAALLKQNPSLKLAIEGHTDTVGNAQSNKTLSERRAKAVMDAIVKQGIDTRRLSSAGFGPDKPIADNKTEEGRAKNRRVELVKK
jgi:outer membrane protein OmpA-like peptidoglycan-associated protein